MKIKSIIAAAAFAVVAVSANAATYSAPVNTAALYTVSGSFEDYLTFNIATPSTFSWSAVNTPVSQLINVGPYSFTFTSNITGLTSSLFSGTPTTGSAVSSSTLNSGDYFIKITGLGAGTGGSGSYVVATSVTAVPEPESYAMFLAGLGIMGAVARRRFAKV